MERGRTRSFELSGARWVGCVLAIIMLTTGCASSRPVAFTSNPGCFPGPAPSDFAVVNENIPHFFAPLIVGAVETSLIARDLSLAPEPSPETLMVFLSFDMLDQSPTREPRDPMGESLMLDTNMEFMARVAVRAVHRGERRWNGTLSRMHSIRGDETIHTPRASMMIQTAVEGLFDGFPATCQ